MSMPIPADADIIDTHADLLDAFTSIDAKLHRIIRGDEQPYIYRNKLYLPASMYNIQLGTIGSGGERNTLIDGLGGARNKDVNSDTQLTYINEVRRWFSMNPLAVDAGGTRVATSGSYAPSWIPITPVAATADGAGNPPATEIAPLDAVRQTDLMIFIGVDTVSAANQYRFDFREDPLGTPAVCIPDWTNVLVPSAARGHHPDHTWGFRMMTTNPNVPFGIADGANGDWPNASTCIFTGFYRYV